MGSFDLSVEMRTGLLYVNVPDTQVFAMPMELGLKFVAIIGLDGVYPKGEFVSDIVNKGYGTLLVMGRIDFKSPGPRGIVNGGILIALQLAAGFIREE